MRQGAATECFGKATFRLNTSKGGKVLCLNGRRFLKNNNNADDDDDDDDQIIMPTSRALADSTLQKVSCAVQSLRWLSDLSRVG